MPRLNEKQTLLVIAGVTVVLCGAAGGGVYWANDLIEQEKRAIEAKEADRNIRALQALSLDHERAAQQAHPGDPGE